MVVPLWLGIGGWGAKFGMAGGPPRIDEMRRLTRRARSRPPGQPEHFTPEEVSR